jgi:hypothetical protein
MNFYKLRLARWGLGQLGALIGIVVSLVFLERLENEVDKARVELRAAKSAEATAGTAPATESAAATSSGKTSKKKKQDPRDGFRRIAERWPNWLFPLLNLVEWAGVALYLVQIPITYAMVRLDYELRWYIVTDRSLRIRAGLAFVQESTMSFANVQQVIVSQGPLQRLLGIADLRVQSAGGGGDRHEHGHGDSLHTGVFHGVDNAGQIRDLILERLRRFREAGLGDPDDATAAHAATEPPLLRSKEDALAAAEELLAEARELRRAAG